MNETPLTGPCADYEHDLVDLLEGGVGPERARIIRLHLASCLQCRSWQAEFTAMDEVLAARLPQPALSADFDRQLQARIANLERPRRADELRARLERDYAGMLASMRRGVRRHLLLDGIGAAAAATCLLMLGRGLVEVSAGVAPLLTALGSQPVSTGTGAVIAIAALGWLAVRNRWMLPGS